MCYVLGCPIRSSGQMLLPQYLISFDTTDRECSLGPTDDLIIFWRSKVNGEGHSRPLRSNVNTMFHEILEQS